MVHHFYPFLKVKPSIIEIGLFQFRPIILQELININGHIGMVQYIQPIQLVVYALPWYIQFSGDLFYVLNRAEPWGLENGFGDWLWGEHVFFCRGFFGFLIWIELAVSRSEGWSYRFGQALLKFVKPPVQAVYLFLLKLYLGF